MYKMKTIDALTYLLYFNTSKQESLNETGESESTVSSFQTFRQKHIKERNQSPKPKVTTSL